ncbi:MAG: PadR family transcriptional regulator [Candidatus Rokubacteria bacterium]|nr:PadR family transcriptional regulator [Candidatus Rokubacteria bacterium]
MPEKPDPLTLQHALLGLLARRPLSGWEILKRFGRSVVFFWNAKRSQIYAELKRMEGLGLLVSRVTVQQRRPNSRRFAITAAGETALRSWLDRPTPVAPIKDEMLLRTFYADLLPPERAVLYLRGHGGEHRRIQEEFEEIKAALEARYGALPETSDEALACGYLVLEQGIRYERMYAEWCEWAAAQLQHRGARTGAARATDPADFIMTS